MKILIEGEKYPISILKNIFDNSIFYQQIGMDGQITDVGYYHSFIKNQLVFLLPKVFMKDKQLTTFGYHKDELLDNNYTSTKHSEETKWLRSLSIYFYNSLKKYRREKNKSSILNLSDRTNLNTNIGDQEYSYLDIVLSFTNFYKKK